MTSLIPAHTKPCPQFIADVASTGQCCKPKRSRRRLDGWKFDSTGGESKVRRLVSAMSVVVAATGLAVAPVSAAYAASTGAAGITAHRMFFKCTVMTPRVCKSGIVHKKDSRQEFIEMDVYGSKLSGTFCLEGSGIKRCAQRVRHGAQLTWHDVPPGTYKLIISTTYPCPCYAVTYRGVIRHGG